MSEASTKQNTLLNLYSSTVTAKQTKLNIMALIRRYLDPSHDDLYIRHNRDLRGISARHALFDSTCMNKIMKYSLTSLADIINPYQTWFTLHVRVEGKDKNSEEFRSWAIDAQDDFLQYINRSNYYKSLITDKSNYDLYGFSALTITRSKKNRKGVLTWAEDPFKVLIYDDDEEVIGVFWEKIYSAINMKLKFGYEAKDEKNEGTVVEGEYGDKKNNRTFYSVVCACFPNNEMFIKNKDKKKKGKYVQIFFIKKRRELAEVSDNIFEQVYADSEMEGVEIGERLYFDELVSCVVRDTQGVVMSYGKGWGQRLIISAVNMNAIHRNLIKTSEFVGNPAFTAPPDLNLRFKPIEAGVTYDQSFTGNKIEPVEFEGRLNEQASFLDVEKTQIDDTIPGIGQPPMKKQRQSQMEVQKMLMEQSKNNFIYKIIYLQEGVACHLKRMFKLAVKQGVIKPPPGGISIKDVEPSLANLILREFKKQKAMSYVETLNMCHGYISRYPEGFDNFKPDFIIRNIAEAKGSEDGIETWDDVKKIRKVRLEQREKQQNQAESFQQAQMNLMSAQGQKATADATKSRAQAQQGGQGGR